MRAAAWHADRVQAGEGQAQPWWPEPPAVDAVEVRLRHEDNRRAWNQAAQQYRAGLDDAVEYLRAGGVHLHPLEREHLGDLGAWCDLAVHLQCASGKDTLSLLNAGAGRVVGVDIAEGHIANARQVSERLGGAAASWYRCDVLDTPHELDGTADLVYTGRGALGWVHDLDGWAAVVGRLLRPGGLFHVLDDHAGAYLFDPAASELRPSGADYFANVTGSRGWTEQYVGDLGREKAEHAVKHERLWPPSAVFGALIRVGLVVEQFGEHPDEYWPAFPHLEPQLRRRLPMTYTITARKP